MITEYKHINYRNTGLLVMVLIILSALLYHSTISLFPSFVHAWTQSERYALSLGFLNNGFDLFHPCTFNLQTVDGITRVDLPLNEYIVAILMKLLGTTSAMIFRIYTLSISIIGCVFLYLLSFNISRSEIKAWSITLFTFLSPLYVYYQAGFIPSVPAISFIFISHYYFLQYIQSGTKKQLYIALTFSLLAALIRIPFLIYLVSTMAFLFLKSIKTKKINTSELTATGICFILFFSYYRYNVHLGRIYGNMFLDNLLPARNMEEFKDILRQIKNVWLFQYHTLQVYLVIIAGTGFMCYHLFRKNKVAELLKTHWIQTLIISSGCILYFSVMMRQFFDHDYYFLDSLFIPSIFILIGTISFAPIETVRLKIGWSIVFILFLIFSFIDTQKVQAERYQLHEWDRVEISRQNFSGADRYLDSIGIPKDAKMLVIDSYSTNIPLILMNRKGYTVYQTSRDDAFMPLIKYKWDYVIIQDQFLVSDVLHYYPIITQFIERIAGNGKISVYKRSPDLKTKTLKTFLNINEKNTVYQKKITYDKEVNDGIIAPSTNLTTEKSLSEPNAAILKSDIEYGNLIEIKGKQFESKDLKAYIKLNLLSGEKLKELQCISAVTSNDSIVNYQSVDIKNFIQTIGAWNKIELLFVPPVLKEGEKWSIYLWNKQRERAYYDDVEIIIYE